MRGSAQKYPDKAESQASAEARLVMFLTIVRPHLRAGITVDTILQTHRLPRKVAEYRLTLAQARWAAEQSTKSEVSA